jgi:hypothetical protein
MSGSVSFRPSSVDEWTAATLNYPLTVGDHMWTDRGSRTELELGSMYVRLAPATEFSVINLDDRLAQLRLTQGTMAVRVRSISPDEAIEIDTPSGAVSLLRPGFYRVDATESGDASTVTVRSGEAEVTAGAAATPVRAQEAVTLEADQPFAPAAAARTDDFEDWCLARDRRVEASATARYVSPDMIGYADLDQYGGWRDTPDYGAVWMPRVSADWVPYRNGHWVWVDPWGWTWIDDAPWGFAPFHYGRWVRLSGGWGWIPGRIVARPVYAPALVAFVGGSGWQASIRIGEPVAWFPLGPREPYVPGYRVSDAYVQRVNMTHVNVTTVNVTNITYVNRTVPGAVTAVPRDAFVRARPVAAVAVAVPRETIRTAPAVATVSVAPQAVSRLGTETVRRAPAPPPAVVNRPVVVRHAPPDTARTAVRENVAPPPQGAPRVPRQAAPIPQPPPPRHPAPPQEQPAPPRQPPPQTQAPPQAQPRTPPAGGAESRAAAEMEARHAAERQNLEARHAAERAQLNARHQQEERAARDGHQRQQLRQQHQQEQQALQERQKRERESVQKRQQEERRKKPQS